MSKSKGVYSNLKAFHYPQKLNKIMNGEIVAPIHVRLKPYNICNHQCFYCCYFNDKVLGENFNKKSMIPRDKIVEIIDDFADMNVKGVILTGGGEPLIYPYIEETILKILKNKIDLAVITNGSNLKNKNAEMLANAKWVRISMDAADDFTYSEIRKIKKGEFNKVIKNVTNFVKIKKECKLAIYYNVNHKNYNQVYEFLKIMHDCGVDNVKVTESVMGNSKDDYDYHNTFVKKVREQLNKAILDFSGNSFEIIDHYNVNPNKDCEEKDLYKKQYSFCPTMFLTMVIGADLGVYSCHDKAYTTKGLLGTIKNQRFKDFWFSDANKNIMKNFNPYLLCNHHCCNNNRNLLLNEFFEIDHHHLSFI